MISMPVAKNNSIIQIPNMVRIKDLAGILNLPVARLIKELIKNNIYATINEEIDYETAAIIAEDLGFSAVSKTKNEDPKESQTPKSASKKEGVLKLSPRPPVVAIMGHVDHGKTTLLDYIRKTKVAESEAGGITQSIGAYQIESKKKPITFIDTPGHEAFQSMRERGARLTDIAVLVVAGDDGVKPQTAEAIKHIQSAKIPMIVAINKMDKPEARVDKIKQELAKANVQIEEWGGDTPVQEISAKTGQGVDSLLATILLVAEMEELKASESGDGLGTVIESHLSASRGPEVSILVQGGTFRVGNLIHTDTTDGKIKKMEDYRGQSILRAGPAMPVKIIGFNDVPLVGSLVQTGKEKTASLIDGKTRQEQKTLDAINQKALRPKIKKLNLIIKADGQGAKEAILENLAAIPAQEVAPYIIEAKVGAITETDILKSQITNAKILGFRVKATNVAKSLAKQLGVKINLYAIIYELIDTVKEGLEEILEPEEEIRELGAMQILEIFRTEKDKMIVGGKITQGIVEPQALIRVRRSGEILGEGILGELQCNKQKAKTVKSGQECGIKFIGGIKIAVNDTLEFYKIEKKKKSL
ncbi:translation initiation factor IF-2 [bacterium (Candidatus Torokbacteria) CG09_land_8_20_14_0_10_42_11]|nr:MAG: translation initiation factor IF-2 [bacterium (Candidatus Torokbacteria) CG09_land_8_20_14_0_10_42_11]